MTDRVADITAPGVGPPHEQAPTLAPSAVELSVHGRMLMGSLEARMFGTAETTRLGRYHLLETLGRGAMGVVYKAYDPQLDRRVAVKVVTLSGAEARARMLREAKALAKLNHPNVVTVHEVGEDGDEMYVAMEYVEGGTLADWCDAHAEPSRARTQALVDFALQALDGLAAAHDLGLVHRDIKPANMLVGDDGRLRVADFGLARAFGPDPDLLTSSEVSVEAEESTSMTRTGAVVGTPAFMALEQFRGVADASSDQFGLCASFFVAFYGCAPYEAKSVAGLLDALEGGRVGSASSKHVPEYVRRVLLRGLQPHAKNRFQDVRALAHALRAGARRRRWAVGSGMIGLGAAAIASLVWASQPDACTDDRSQIEAVLAGEPERIEALIEASGRPHADELSNRFAADLEGVADRWAEQRLDACRASRDRDPEVATAGEHRMRCLDDALETTEQALGEIESLTRAQADALLTITQFIQGAHECADADAEVFDTERGRELLALFRAGLVAEGRLELDEALRAYEAVLDESAPGEFAELRSEVHTRLAENYERTGDQAAFEHHLIGSLDEAENARDAGLTALHWLAVADTLPVGESAEAYELIVSRSYRARARGPIADRTLAQLLYVEAHDRIDRGQFDRALALTTEAIEVGEKVGAPALAFMYELESTLRLRNGELERAQARARDAVRVHTAAVGEHHPEVAMLLLRLGQVQSWQGRDAEAIETYSRGIATLEERPDYVSASLVAAYESRANSLYNTKRLEEALADYDKAAAMAEGLGDDDVARLAALDTDRARTYRLMGRNDDALALLDAVLAAGRDGSVQGREVLVDASILRAGVLADVERDEEAYAQLERAVPMIEETFGTEGILRIQAAFEVADIYSQVGRHARAQAELERFLPQTEDEPMWRGILEQSRARDYAAQGRTEDARTWAERALESMRASGAGQHELDPIEALIASLDGP